MAEQDFPKDEPQEEATASPQTNAPAVNVASKNWKADFALSKKMAPMPAKNWKVQAWLVNVKPLDPKKEKEKKTPKPIARKTPLAPIGKKKKQRILEEWSEVDLFREIWETREHKCELQSCQNPIKWAFLGKSLVKPQCFAHVLSKGMYPRFRLVADNIKLVCSIECHHAIDVEFNDLEKRRKFESKLILTNFIPNE